MRIEENLFLRSGFIGLLILLTFTIQVSAADKPIATKPNILLIMADDMATRTLAVLGARSRRQISICWASRVCGSVISTLP